MTRFFISLPLAIFAIFFLGCSDQDAHVLERKNQNPVSNQCGRIDLSKGSLDRENLKGFINCIASNGRYQELQRWYTKLPLSTQRDLAEWMDTHWIRNPKNFDFLTNISRNDRAKDFFKIFQKPRLIQSWLRASGEFQLDEVDPNVLKNLSHGLLRLLLSRAMDESIQNVRMITWKPFFQRWKAINQERDPLYEFLWDLDLWIRAVRDTYGVSAEQLKKSLPHISWAARALFDPTRNLFEAFHHYALKMGQPVFCLKQSRYVLDPIRMTLEEWARYSGKSSDFFGRHQLINLAASAPFCDFPSEVSEGYPILREFAASGIADEILPFVITAFGLKANGERPILDWLSYWFSYPFNSEIPQFLSDIVNNRMIEDVVLLLSHVEGPFFETLFQNRSSYQKQLTNYYPSFRRALAELDEKTIDETFQSWDHIKDFIAGLYMWLGKEKNSDLVASFLDFPISVKKALIDPHSIDFIQSIPKMEQEGEIASLVDSVSLWVLGEKKPASPFYNESFSPEYLHDLTHLDISLKTIDPLIFKNTIDVTDPCTGAYLSQNIFDLDKNGLEPLSAYIRCALEASNPSPLIQSLENGRSVFITFFHLFQSVLNPLSKEQLHDLMFRWSLSVEKGTFNDLLKVLSYFFDQASEFFNWLSKAVQETESFNNLQEGLARFVQNNGFESILQTRFMPLQFDWVPSLAELEPSRAKRWLQNRECLSEKDSVERVKTLRSQFLEELPFEHKLKTRKAIDTLLRDSKGNLIAGLLRFLRFYSKNPDLLGEWLWDRAHSQKLITYFPDEAEDDDAPLEVKMVSDLDRLEIVLQSADVGFVYESNFAKKYLREFSESWGDLDRSVWPEEIQDRFHRTMPPRLVDVVESIESMQSKAELFPGYPDVPRCRWVGSEKIDPDERLGLERNTLNVPGFWETKRKIYNARQVLSVLRQTDISPIRNIAFALRSSGDWWQSGYAFDLILQTGAAGILRSLSGEIGLLPESQKQRFVAEVSSLIRLAGRSEILSLVSDTRFLKMRHEISKIILKFVENRDDFSDLWGGLLHVVSLVDGAAQHAEGEWLPGAISVGFKNFADHPDQLEAVLHTPPIWDWVKDLRLTQDTEDKKRTVAILSKSFGTKTFIKDLVKVFASSRPEFLSFVQYWKGVSRDEAFRAINWDGIAEDLTKLMKNSNGWPVIKDAVVDQLSDHFLTRLGSFNPNEGVFFEELVPYLRNGSFEEFFALAKDRLEETLLNY